MTDQTDRARIVAWLRAQSEEAWRLAAAARVARQPNRSIVQTAMSDAYLTAANAIEAGEHAYRGGGK